MTHPGPDRIFRVLGRTITIVAEGAQLQGPNGIVWDEAGQRLIMVPFGGTTIFTGKEGSGAMPMALGPGQHDGVVILDGRILVSSWADSSVSEIGGERDHEGDHGRAVARGHRAGCGGAAAGDPALY